MRFEEFHLILGNQFEKLRNVENGTLLVNCGIDSLGALELLLFLEDEFGVEPVALEGLGTFTIRQLFEAISKYEGTLLD